jgi:hypothetical protein
MVLQCCVQGIDRIGDAIWHPVIVYQQQDTQMLFCQSAHPISITGLQGSVGITIPHLCLFCEVIESGLYNKSNPRVEHEG